MGREAEYRGAKAWHGEVEERQKQAREYKQRGWESSLTPEHVAELYKKQSALMDAVSRRSSLSALALATPSPPSSRESIRGIGKEDKDKESRKSMPTSTRGSPRAPTYKPLQRGTSFDRPPLAAHHSPKKVTKHETPKRPPTPKKEEVKVEEDEAPKQEKRGSDPTTKHHLPRTTGGGAGVLIWSTTRNRLEPV